MEFVSYLFLIAGSTIFERSPKNSSVLLFIFPWLFHMFHGLSWAFFAGLHISAVHFYCMPCVWRISFLWYPVAIAVLVHSECFLLMRLTMRSSLTTLSFKKWLIREAFKCMISFDTLYLYVAFRTERRKKFKRRKNGWKVILSPPNGLVSLGIFAPWKNSMVVVEPDKHHFFCFFTTFFCWYGRPFLTKCIFQLDSSLFLLTQFILIFTVMDFAGLAMHSSLVSCSPIILYLHSIWLLTT